MDEHAGPWDQLRQDCQMVWLGRMPESHIGQELSDWVINKAYWTYGRVLSLKGNIQPYLKSKSFASNGKHMRGGLYLQKVTGAYIGCLSLCTCVKLEVLNPTKIKHS